MSRAASTPDFPLPDSDLPMNSADAPSEATATGPDTTPDQPQAKVKYKRRKKLIDKALQLKLVGVFTAIGCTCALFQIVLINNGLLEIARVTPNAGPEILGRARGMMLTNVLWTLGAMVPLMACIGIVLTHRIAGPAFRMTRHMNEIAQGAPVTECWVRKEDELQDLCAAMNAALTAVATREAQTESTTKEWALEETPSIVRAAQGTGALAESEPAA